MTVARQTLIGLGLAGALITAWLALHVYGVFFHRFDTVGVIVAPLMISTACWLNVGLFIIAHDALHGSLAPGRPAVNRAFGLVALRLYAGFSFERLRPKHFEHHNHSGTEHDPDFSTHQSGFWRWYGAFLHQYFGFREWLVLAVISATYLLIGASLANLLLFWALPAILSSVQLFYFGTYLPHRCGDDDFADHHRARSNGFGWLGSLLSCYHFGYHHEHHLAPHVPWWRLPAERRRRATAR